VLPVALPPGRLKLSTILQSGQAFAAISIRPLANRPRADAWSFRDASGVCPFLGADRCLMYVRRPDPGTPNLCQRHGHLAAQRAQKVTASAGRR
jgi:hypothetical protein